MFLYGQRFPTDLSQGDWLKSAPISLIDFGFATRYLSSKTGIHVDCKDVDELRGNIIFASLNQMNFKTTSRKDDLTSLFFLMVYLFGRGALDGVDFTLQNHPS